MIGGKLSTQPAELLRVTTKSYFTRMWRCCILGSSDFCFYLAILQLWSTLKLRTLKSGTI